MAGNDKSAIMPVAFCCSASFCTGQQPWGRGGGGEQAQGGSDKCSLKVSALQCRRHHGLAPVAVLTLKQHIPHQQPKQRCPHTPLTVQPLPAAPSGVA